jgi:hypothetical protein
MRCIIVGLTLLFASPALAESTIAIAPVFSQLVTMPIPVGFQSIFEDASTTNYIHEAVPLGETVNDWSQMITLLAGADLVTGQPADDAVAMAEGFAGNYSSACPATMSAVALDAPPVPGAVATFAGYISCGDTGGGQSESMVFVVMVGAQDVYALQWAARGPASAAPLGYDPGTWTPRLQELVATARLCDPVAGEAPPYPSCLSD